MGEKAGNVDMGEAALSLYLLYGVDAGIRYGKLNEVSKLVEQLSGIKMPPIKPVTGENVFKREAGAAVLQLTRYPPAVEVFPPELVGGKREIVLGKKSGRHSIEWKLNKLGITATEEQIKTILSKVKAESEKKKALITDEEFKLIIKQVL